MKKLLLKISTPVYLHIIKIDIQLWTTTGLEGQNPGIRTNSPYCNILLWTSFSFLQVNHKRIGMVSTNKQ